MGIVYTKVRTCIGRQGNLKKKKKPSADFYKEIIENNGFSQDILRKYLKEMPSLALN